MRALLEDLLTEDGDATPSVLDVDLAGLVPPPAAARPAARFRPLGTFEADDGDDRRHRLPALLIGSLVATVASCCLLLAGALALS
jgi:hypothetical protein